MRIIIPTKGRISNQLTYQNLPEELRKQTTFVCPQSEGFWLEQKYPAAKVIRQLDPNMRIGDKRKWIMDTTEEEKIVMLDDDLRFAVRRDDNPGLFRKAEPADISRAFFELGEILSPEVAHGGFSVRGSGIGTSAKKGGWQISGKRMQYSLGYHVPTVNANASFGRLNSREDMDVTLQLLTKGYPNAVNFSFVTDQKFGNPGGCTAERVIELADIDALALVGYFPQFVTAVQKEYKDSPNRLEVVCQWQKALDYGYTIRGE